MDNSAERRITNRIYSSILVVSIMILGFAAVAMSQVSIDDPIDIRPTLMSSSGDSIDPIETPEAKAVDLSGQQPKSGLSVQNASVWFDSIGTMDKFGDIRYQTQPNGLSVQAAMEAFANGSLDKFGDVRQVPNMEPRVFAPIFVVPLGQSDTSVESAAVSTLPVIDIWYGPNQKFGQIGQPQVWANIFGNASDPDGLSSLSYTLNGGSSTALSYGADNRRLWNTGDFNIDISTSSLISGVNQVIVTAEDTLSNSITETVNFTYTANTTWPTNYSIDWSQEADIQDVAQIVDGKWTLDPNGIRVVEPGYDRVIAIGDVTWTDYEVETQFTIHSMITTTNWYPGVGAILRWNGHSDSPISGWQPKSGWLPMAALGWAAYFRPNGLPPRMQMGGYQTGVENKNFNYTLGQPYNFKIRGETVSATESTYSMKVWEDGQTEPSSWDLVYSDTTSGVADGSLLLIAQMVDATFGDVTITDLTGNPTPTPTFTPTPTPTPTATPIPSNAEPLSKLFASSRTDGVIGAVTFNDEDVLAYDLSTGQWELFLDGSDLGIGGDINAFTILDDGSMLFSLTSGATLAGAGSVDDSDIVRFIPTSTGDTTAGTMELYFDGSDVELESSSEDVYAISVLDDGRLILSMNGAVAVTGLSAADEDLLEFTPSQLGDTTTGTWALYFDGSDVELTDGDEDLWGVWTDNETGEIHLSSVGLFSVTGASGDWMDVFTCTPSSLGTSTACSYSLAWDGSAEGFTGHELDAIAFGRPPSTVNLISPTGTIVDTLPTFIWDTDPLALTYTLVVYDVVAGTVTLSEEFAESAVCSAGTCSTTASTSLPPGSYKWLIQASNYAGYGPWSTAP